MLKILRRNLRLEPLLLIEVRNLQFRNFKHLEILIYSAILTLIYIEELGLTFDRNEPPAITIDVASDTEFIIFNLSSLPIKNDGLMTLRISSIANSGQSYSFWAREARDPSRIPILSLGK